LFQLACSVSFVYLWCTLRLEKHDWISSPCPLKIGLDLPLARLRPRRIILLGDSLLRSGLDSILRNLFKANLVIPHISRPGETGSRFHSRAQSSSDRFSAER